MIKVPNKMTDFRGGIFWNFKQGFKVTSLKYMINISGNQWVSMTYMSVQTVTR